MSLVDDVSSRIRGWVSAWPQRPDAAALYRVLRFLAQWRSIMLANTFVAREGSVIHGGLFKGMQYLPASAEGALMPRLLGVYESELHPYLRRFLETPPEAIIDVGCAEGYYAVGLARLVSGATVYAHDIDDKARAACARLAEINGVSERVVVGGEFTPADFARFADKRTLVIVDAEGAELEVLKPEAAPALAGMSLIVETHDVYRPGAEREIVARFAATHDIVRVTQQQKVCDLPPWMHALNQLDQLIAVWEFRLQPTPWLILTPRMCSGPPTG
jgi:hypothetical protein